MQLILAVLPQVRADPEVIKAAVSKAPCTCLGGKGVHRGKMREEARLRDSACFLSHSLTLMLAIAAGSLACAEVFQDGLALAYANQELQGDEDVVEAVFAKCFSSREG